MRAVPTTFDIAEQSSGCYLALITDDSGVTMIPGSALTSLTLTLYVINTDGTRSYCNGRNAQDVLNLNDVTVYDAIQTDPSGHQYNLKWSVRPEDTTFVNVLLKTERHWALFQWTSGASQGKHEVILAVKNLVEVG